MTQFNQYSLGVAGTRLMRPGRGIRFFAIYTLVSAAAMIVLMAAMDPTPRQPDERFYLTVAADLYHHNVFSTARARGIGPPDDGIATPAPDNYVPPLYPAFLATVATVSPGLRASMDCAKSSSETTCGTADLSTLFVLQAAIGTLSLAAAAVAFRMVSADPVYVAGALVALIGIGLPVQLASSVLPDALVLAAQTAFAACFLSALCSGRAAPWLIAGGFVGIAALLKPSALYLPILVAPFLLLFRGRAGGRAALLLAIGTAVMVAPWIARNAAVLGTTGFTGEYGGVILAQRVAYNAMTGQEWLASLIYWLPDFGDRLAAALFDPSAFERLRWEAPNGFYLTGNSTVIAAFRELAGPEGSITQSLIRYGVLSQPVAHAAVTVPLYLRGLWVGGYAALAAILLLPVLLWAQRGNPSLARFGWLAAPFLMLTLLHAGATINIPRYNPALSLIYAGVYGYAAVTVAGLCRGHRRGGPGMQGSPTR